MDIYEYIHVLATKSEVLTEFIIQTGDVENVDTQELPQKGSPPSIGISKQWLEKRQG